MDNVIAPTALSTFYTPTAADAWPQTASIVDAVGIGEQHAVRRWEYALALEAIRRWQDGVPDNATYSLADVGGAGSRFTLMAAQTVGCDDCRIVDPSYVVDPVSLEQHLRSRPRLADVVTCLSVLEHVDNLRQFLYHLACLVRPGGLLVLTVDACGYLSQAWEPVPDPYHFHWMRQRIFGPHQLVDLRFWMNELRCPPLDDPDYSAYPGPFVYDYSAAALVLQKKA